MKRAFFSILTIITIFFIGISPAIADFSWPQPREAAGQILDYIGVGRPGSTNGLDAKEVKYYTRSFNVSRQKKIPPQVMLTFNPSNPVPGEKVTAVAKPMYFMSDLTKMYYTWYIKHADDNRDLNGDGDEDVEDYKIEAARIIASNDFEWDKPDTYDTDTDDDGYRAIMGGEEQRGKADHCYIHNPKTGDEYELSGCDHLFPNAPGEETGDGVFGKDEERFWRTDPTNSDTAATGNLDEATVSGLGVTEFTWNYREGDKVGVAVEGISVEPTHYKDASYKIMWALPKNIWISNRKDSRCDVNAALEKVREGTITETTTETSMEEVINEETGEPETLTTTVVTTVETTTTIDNAPESSATLTIVTTIVTTVTDEEGNVRSETTDESTKTRTKNLFQMATKKINNCLEDNLADPTEGGETNKIDVKLSYFPKSPVNDSSVNGDGELTLENSDELVVNASLLNIRNEKYLKYVWQVYTSTEPDPDSWGNPISKQELPEITQMSGIGLDTLSFKLAFTEKTSITAKNERPRTPLPDQAIPAYVKIKLTASETVSKQTVREGHSDVIVHIETNPYRIKVYPVSVSDNLDITMQDTDEKERCKEKMDRVICPVVKNEITGLKVPGSNLTNFSWTVDGEPMVYNDLNCSFGECDKRTGESTNQAYFPVLKDKGEYYTVTFIAEKTEKDKNTGEKVNITRTFEVVDPKITISSADEDTTRPVLLGNYIDLDNKKWPDYSDKEFETVVGAVVKVKATPNTGYTDDYVWFIDESEAMPGIASLDEEEHTLSFVANKDVGELYRVSVATVYGQNNQVRKALHKYWNVSLSEFYETPVSDIIKIKLMNTFSGTEDTIARGGAPDKKFLAALSSNLPSYMSFLLRAVLTILLILVASGFIFSFFPTYEEK